MFCLDLFCGNVIEYISMWRLLMSFGMCHDLVYHTLCHPNFAYIYHFSCLQASHHNHSYFGCSRRFHELTKCIFSLGYTLINSNLKIIMLHLIIFRELQFPSIPNLLCSNQLKSQLLNCCATISNKYILILIGMKHAFISKLL